MRKALAILISIVMLVQFLPVLAEETLSEDIVILYTNDVHTYIDGILSYDVISAIKQNLQKQYKYVILADAGDHIQGTAYGSMDKGERIIELMNAAGYDIATLGNHEFDYGMAGCMNVIEQAQFQYISSNFYHEKDGVRDENVIDSYVMFHCGDEKLAVIGITTPETFSKSTPAYFQDENGNFIYGISGGEEGDDLHKDVQDAIDAAKNEGATKIVALGHLGTDVSSTPWTSEETIAGICGLDAFIDGHSHSTVEGKIVEDKNGHDVLLTQTGEYFNRIGIMVIDSETDEITADFIECEKILAEDGETVTGNILVSKLYDGTEIVSDSDVKEIKDAWITEIDENLGKIIGTTELVFDNYDDKGNRIVRTQETNSGDFAADALYYLFDNMELDVDVAVMNAGGIRNNEITGDISYKTCKNMHTFGNVACLQTISGQQLLDALEWGARNVGLGENGGFLHVSGVTYKVDTAIENTVKEDELGTWVAGPDKYRVFDVKVYNKKTNTYDALDTDAFYNIAGYNYTLCDLGDGFAMFDGAVNVLDYVMEDYMVLANYIQGFDDGVVGASNSPLAEKYPGFLVDYVNFQGSGRIEIGKGLRETAFDDEIWFGGIKVPDENKDDVFNDGGKEFSNPFEDVSASEWYYGDVKYVVLNGLFNGTAKTTFEPNSNLTRAMLVTVLYRAEGEPATNRSIPFSDVDMGLYYGDAVSWAKQNGIVNGTTENEFEPDSNITREQIAAIIYSYAQYKGYDISDGEDVRLTRFDDYEAISQYAIPAFKYTIASEIIKGKTDKTINPKDNATRAEVAAILHRFITSDR